MTEARRERSADSFRLWRDAISTKLREAEAYHRPAIPLDHDAVADMLNVVLEGGFIMSKVLDDAQLLVRYLRALRAFLEASFGIALTAGSTSGDRARRSGSGPDRARA